MRFYIATTLKNSAQAMKLAGILQAAGHEPTYSWWEHGSVQAEGLERIAQVAGLEADGVRGADLVIVLLPGGRGTHTELGIAIGSRKPIFLLEDPTFGLLDRSYGDTCAFYYHPCVQRYTDELTLVATVASWRAIKEVA